MAPYGTIRQHYMALVGIAKGAYATMGAGNGMFMGPAGRAYIHAGRSAGPAGASYIHAGLSGPAGRLYSHDGFAAAVAVATEKGRLALRT
jgi:hypothetical protein